MKLFNQAITLIISFVFIFVWENTGLVDMTPQLLGLLVAVYLILSLRKKGHGFFTMGGGGILGIFLLNSLVLLLLFSTGGINSVLFFVLYFLCFGIAFVFEPTLVFLFALGVVLILIPNLNSAEMNLNVIKLASFVFISPLAFFFGKQYQKSDKEEEKINAIEERTKDAADTIAEDIAEVIKDEKAELKIEDVEKLNEVLEETEELRLESKD